MHARTAEKITLEEKMLPLWKTFFLLQGRIRKRCFPQKNAETKAFGKVTCIAALGFT